MKAEMKKINPTSNGIMIIKDDDNKEIAAVAIISLNGVDFRNKTYQIRCKEVYDMLIKSVNNHQKV